MARTLNSSSLPLGIHDADGKPVFRKPLVETKPVPVRDEAAEHRSAMLAQAKTIADLLKQNADLLEAVQAMIVRPEPARQVDAWEFTIERDGEGLTKKVNATPKKPKS